jgi:hypothetical protein
MLRCSAQVEARKRKPVLKACAAEVAHEKRRYAAPLNRSGFRSA